MTRPKRAEVEVTPRSPSEDDVARSKLADTEMLEGTRASKVLRRRVHDVEAKMQRPHAIVHPPPQSYS
jgi:hypothetical protein